MGVCPPEDNPIPQWLWLGWGSIGTRLWGSAPHINPITFYRWRGRDLLRDLALAMPWLFVAAGQLALMRAARATGIQAAIALDFLLLLLLPFLMGCYTQMLIHGAYQRLKTNTSFEELVVTHLRPTDYVAGFMLRPLLAQTFGLLLSTVVYIVGMFVMIFVTIGFSPGDVVTILFCTGLAIYRYLVTNILLHLAAVQAIRAALFIPDGVEARTRMVRDFAPWGFFPAIVVVSTIAVFWISGFMGGWGWTLTLFWVLNLIALVFALPGIVYEYAAEHCFYMLQSFGGWSLWTGERSHLAPRSILHRWQLNRKTLSSFRHGRPTG